MEACAFVLFFEDVDPNVDQDLLFQKFNEHDMDVLLAIGKLDEGQLALDVSSYDDNLENAAMKAIDISESIIGEGTLTKVTSDKDEIVDINKI